MNYSKYLVKDLGGIAVNKVHSQSRAMGEGPDSQLHLSKGYVYCSPCLIVNIGMGDEMKVDEKFDSCNQDE